MSDPTENVVGFHAPVHRSLSDPILLGGAPRTVAIANGTLAPRSRSACVSGFPDFCCGRPGMRRRSGPPSATRKFVDVVRRHLRYPAHFGS